MDKRAGRAGRVTGFSLTYPELFEGQSPPPLSPHDRSNSSRYQGTCGSTTLNRNPFLGEPMKSRQAVSVVRIVKTTQLPPPTYRRIFRQLCSVAPKQNAAGTF